MTTATMIITLEDMTRANPYRPSRPSRGWLARLLLVVALLLAAALPPYLDPTPPADSTPTPAARSASAADSIYAWAQATHLFW